MRQTRCVDCNKLGRQTTRAAAYPGPRCLDHHREQIRMRSRAAHGRRLERNFEIDSDTYDYIKEKQGGVCFGCGRATGERKRLAVDHDHHKDGCDHPPEMGCINCIRALLCGYCNEVLGRLDADALRRLITVVEDPPAQRILRAMMAVEDDGSFQL